MKRRLEKSGQAFSFSEKNKKHLQAVIKKYPKGRAQSAIKEALYTAQRQEGWISQEAVEEIATFLDIPAIHVYEVSTFYTMFHLAPVGRYHLQVCTTTPCWLRGSDEVLSACQKAAKKHGKEVFTTTEVECLGGCANAPILQINNDYYEDLEGSSTTQLLDDLAEGKECPSGSAIGRQGAAPFGEPVTLVSKAGSKASAKKEASKQSEGADVTG